MEAFHSDAASNQPHLMAGYYDCNKRELGIFNDLQLDFQRIREENLHFDRKGHQYVESRDIFSKLLDDFETLKNDASKYVGPHFTKEYRRLQERCGKLERELDKVDITNKPDLRIKRKNIIMEIDALAKELATNAHSDGKCCPLCDIQQ